MKPLRLVLLTLVATVAFARCAPSDQDSAEQADGAASADETPTVVLETNKGRILVEIDRENAPLTATNFLRHVGAGFFDGLTFHRVRPGFMIQGGRITADRQRRTSQAAALTNEADNGLKNLRGTIAMARTSVPHSAVSEFFINVVDNPSLDHTGPTLQGWGYAVFGHVTQGMDVVDEIAGVPTERWGQHEAVPVDPIVIERAYIQESSAN